MQQPLYGGGHPHTPRTPATPNAPGPTGNMPYPQSSQPGGRGGLYQVAPHSQYPPPQGYATSAAMMSQATTASSHQQPLAPSPNPGRGAPILRPMPAGGVMPQQAGLSSPYGPGPAMQQSSGLQEGEPTHVVGSQGRRGVLPSAPGRPQISQVNTKGTAIPQKDADGKFPCPHCTKTYLHAKHLKRHLLRRKWRRTTQAWLPTDEIMQIPAIGHICVCCAAIPSLGVIFSSATFRNARFVGEIPRASVTFLTLAHT
jgi:hypothetical protein